MSGAEGLFPVSTSDEAGTRAVGRRLAGMLEPGAVVALWGDLGAGKTQFVKGIVGGLGGAEEAVTSPTFTIVQEYDTPKARVLHVDTYRVRHPREFVELGIEEILYGDAVVVIEWPEALEPLPEGTLRLRIDHAGGTARRIDRHSP